MLSTLLNKVKILIKESLFKPESGERILQSPTPSFRRLRALQRWERTRILGQASLLKPSVPAHHPKGFNYSLEKLIPVRMIVAGSHNLWLSNIGTDRSLNCQSSMYQII